MSGTNPYEGIGKIVVPVEDFMDTDGFDSVVAPRKGCNSTERLGAIDKCL